MVNATTTTFDLAALFGKPILFSDMRIDPTTLPVDLHAYELRHSDDDIRVPVSMEKHVAVSFYGTVISQSPVELTHTKHSCAIYDERSYLPIHADDFALDDYGSLTLQEYIDGEYELTPPPEKEIRVVVVEPMKPPYEAVVPNKLESFQKLVGGYIETVSPFNNDVILVCNEEGKINGLPLNRRVGDDIIAGTFFLCKDNLAGDFASLTQEQVKACINRFSTVERYAGMKQVPHHKPRHKADYVR